MPINLPPINQQLIKGVEQARVEQIATLAKLLGTSVGNSLLASVEKVEPITPQQQGDLLKRTDDLLQQLYRSPATPLIKAQINQLLEQQQLLNAPQLKWVHLLVNSRPLLTYTDKPLQAGQALPLLLADAQRLVQLGSLSPKLAEIITAQSATKPLTTALAPTTASATSVNLRSAPPTLDTLATTTTSTATNVLTSKWLTEISPSTSELKVSSTALHTERPAGSREPLSSPATTLLAAALRNLLPQKDQPQELYNALPNIQQLSLSTRHELLSDSVQKALKTLADQLRSPAQLSNPKLLQMVIKNSGVFFEHKLAQHAATTTAPTTPTATISTTNQSAANNVLTNRLTTQDLKGALLHLLNRVTQDLSKNTLPEASAASVAIKSHAAPTSPHFSVPQLSSAVPPTLPSLLAFLHQLPERAVPELSSKVLRTQLLMLLQQHTLSSLGKVQLQQAQSLNHQQGQTDTTQPTQSWGFDIPVKHGHDVHTLEMRLQKDWVEKDSDESQENAGKFRQWSVTLSFTLPDAGKFYAQLTVVNENVSAKLWAEETATLIEAKQKLDRLREQLESQGVTVKQLLCVQGSPPNTAISLQYSLVDVTT